MIVYRYRCGIGSEPVYVLNENLLIVDNGIRDSVDQQNNREYNCRAKHNEFTVVSLYLHIQ